MKRIFIAAMAALALCSCAQEEKTTLRLVHYNVGAFSKTAESSTEVIANMMYEIGADVVSCNEVDSCTVRTGKVDQLAEMALKLTKEEGVKWAHHYTAAMPYDGGAYGVGFCYKEELGTVKKDGVALPKLDGKEPRALSVVELDKCIIATCHLDYKTAASQMGQIAVINEYMDSNYKDSQKPIFIFGDFNCFPDSEPIAEMLKTWTLISHAANTFPSHAPDRCIDFIFMRPQGKKVEVSKAVVPTEFETGNVATASDHLPVYVDVTF